MIWPRAEPSQNTSAPAKLPARPPLEYQPLKRASNQTNADSNLPPSALGNLLLLAAETRRCVQQSPGLTNLDSKEAESFSLSARLGFITCAFHHLVNAAVMETSETLKMWENKHIFISFLTDLQHMKETMFLWSYYICFVSAVMCNVCTFTHLETRQNSNSCINTLILWSFQVIL